MQLLAFYEVHVVLIAAAASSNTTKFPRTWIYSKRWDSSFRQDLASSSRVLGHLQIWTDLEKEKIGMTETVLYPIPAFSEGDQVEKNSKSRAPENEQNMFSRSVQVWLELVQNCPDLADNF